MRLLVITILFISSIVYANQQYFLCGPDEDGCYPKIYEYCHCIPMHTKLANRPFCLDFDNLTCLPLSEQPNCDNDFIYKDQGSCLAVIFQGTDNPSCKKIGEDFCIKHRSNFCKEDGNPSSCKQR